MGATTYEILCCIAVEYNRCGRGDEPARACRAFAGLAHRLSAAGPAAAAEPVWDGTVTLTSVAPKCKNARVTFKVNQVVTTIAGPVSVQPGLMFLFHDGTFLMTMLTPDDYGGSLMTKAAKLAISMTARKYTLVTKPKFNPNVKKFTATGSAQNFANEDGCTVKFSGAFTKRAK